MIGWINTRTIDGDYFRIQKLRSSHIPLSYFLDKIDLDRYFIYKATNTFRRVEVEDIGKFALYTFFRKNLYCKDHIDKWIEEIKEIDNGKFMFLNKPFPRIEILEKIEVI